MSKITARKIVKIYGQSLKKQGFPFKKILLYGSYAKGLSGDQSDLDVCVVSDRFGDRNWNQAEQELWRLRRKIDLRIEPIGMSPQEFNDLSPLAAEIKKNGIVIMSS